MPQQYLCALAPLAVPHLCEFCDTGALLVPLKGSHLRNSNHMLQTVHL